MLNLVLMTKEAIRKEYNNSAVHEEALQKSDVYFVNRKKNQKHKKVLELKEDAEEQLVRITTTKKKKQPQQQKRKKKKQLPPQNNKQDKEEDNGIIRGDIISTQRHHHKSRFFWLSEPDSCSCAGMISAAFFQLLYQRSTLTLI